MLLLIVLSSLAAARQSVLMIVVDDLRAEFGQSFDAPEVLTPHIDALAASGTRFSHAFAQAPTCGVSRSSALTGRRPDTTQVLENGGCPFTNNPKHKDWVSMPRWFKNHNYTTIGTGKVFHPGVCHGLVVGEDPNAWTSYFHAPGPNNRTKSSCANGAYLNGTCDSGKTRTLSLLSNASLAVGPGGSPFTDGTPDGQVAQFAIDKLHEIGHQRHTNASAGDQPFFLAVGLHKPHLPHVAPQHYFDLYEESNVSLPPSPNTTTGLPALAYFKCIEAFTYPDWKAEADDVSWSQTQPLRPEACRRHRRAYFASLSYIDALVGGIMAALHASGLAGDTVVALWADHGWALGDNNEWGKHTAYYRTNHVPMIFVPPAKVRSSESESKSKSKSEDESTGAVVADFVELVNVYPTLAALAGIDIPPVCANAEESASKDACVEAYSLAHKVQGWGGYEGRGAFLEHGDLLLEPAPALSPVSSPAQSPAPREQLASIVSPNRAFWQWSKMMIEKLPVMGYAMAAEVDVSDIISDVSVEAGNGNGRTSTFASISTGSAQSNSSTPAIITVTDMRRPFRYTAWVGYDFHRYEANFSDLRAVELYDLESDPEEGENIAATRANSSMVQQVTALMHEALLAGWRAALPGALPDSPAAAVTRP